VTGLYFISMFARVILTEPVLKLQGSFSNTVPDEFVLVFDVGWVPVEASTIDTKQSHTGTTSCLWRHRCYNVE
jgi:hypothetical protein